MEIDAAASNETITFTLKVEFLTILGLPFLSNTDDFNDKIPFNLFFWSRKKNTKVVISKIFVNLEFQTCSQSSHICMEQMF